MKKLIYTVHYGNYDKIHEPTMKTPGWDYIMVTDNKDLKSKGWDVFYYDESLSRRIIARKMFILHNFLFSNYDISIMCGGQYTVNCDLDKFIKNKMSDSADMAIAQHPGRFCIYRELEACVYHKKITREQSKIIYKIFVEENIPKEFGMVQTGVMIRKHERENLEQFSEFWFEQTKRMLRDQLSFMYSYWKTRLISFDLFSNEEINNNFILNTHSNGT